MSEIVERWIKNITPIFPAKAEFRYLENPPVGHIIRVNWLLENDPNRPNQRSRSIEIRIHYEPIEDYPGESEEDRNRADNRFESFIRARFENFNPDHDKPKGKSPEPEIWEIKWPDLFHR